MSQPGQSPKPGFYFHPLEGFRAVAVIFGVAAASYAAGKELPRC